MISKRKSTGRITGRVLLDGREASAWDLKSATAYIQQDDALAGFFSVGETIAFAAEMKMARGTPAAERRARVEEVARAMGLTRCLHVQVGNRMVRGISGGERKRTSVACGLLSKPRGIFMARPPARIGVGVRQPGVRLLAAGLPSYLESRLKSCPRTPSAGRADERAGQRDRGRGDG